MVFESSQLCRFDTTTWFAVDQGLAEVAPQATGGSPMECDVGLDVHSETSVFVIRDGGGQVMAQGELPTTPFRAGMRRSDCRPVRRIALETGTMAFYVARELWRCSSRRGKWSPNLLMAGHLE